MKPPIDYSAYFQAQLDFALSQQPKKPPVRRRIKPIIRYKTAKNRQPLPPEIAEKL